MHLSRSVAEIAAVYAVHATRPDDVGAVEIIFRTEAEVRHFARQRSSDTRFWAASVTRYDIGVFGSRHPLAWYVDGEEQDPRVNRPYYGTDGPVAAF